MARGVAELKKSEFYRKEQQPWAEAGTGSKEDQSSRSSVQRHRWEGVEREGNSNKCHREEAVTFEARMILGRAETAGRDSFTAKRTREANPEVQDITVINKTQESSLQTAGNILEHHIGR